MDIKNHGNWLRYRPGKVPEGAPENAMFAQRYGDGVDWYDYVNSGKNFAEDSVKMTVVNGAVAAAVIDPTMLFPGGATVLEVTGEYVADPQKAFGTKLYDPDSKSFSTAPPVEYPDPLAEIRKRLEALEAKGE